MSTERRVTTLLATVAPLTPGQICRALALVDRLAGNDLIQTLYSERVLCRVSCSPAQRQLSGGTGSAYALAPVTPRPVARRSTRLQEATCSPL